MNNSFNSAVQIVKTYLFEESMMCIIKLIIKLIIIKLIIITYFNFILIILEIYIYKSNIVYMYIYFL